MRRRIVNPDARIIAEAIGTTAVTHGRADSRRAHQCSEIEAALATLKALRLGKASREEFEAAARATPFDPARWLREAVAIGYTVYLMPPHGADQRHAIYFENPTERTQPASDDIWLWWWLNCPGRDNLDTLRTHLLTAGSVAGVDNA